MMIRITTIVDDGIILLLFLSIIFFLTTCEVSSSSSSSSIISLTKDNFQEVTAGKTVFIKWFAPWCGHCQAIKPIWEELAYKLSADDDDDDDDNLIICEVDCTTNKQNEDWCIEMGITGFPTLNYGETSYDGIFLQEYNDHNDIDDDDEHDNNKKKQQKILQNLYNFANTKLRRPYCSPGNIVACPPDEQRKMYRYWNMTIDDINIAIESNTKQIEVNERDYKSKLDSMQYQYDQASQQYEIDIAKHKRQIKFYHNIIKFQQQKQQTEVSSTTT